MRQIVREVPVAGRIVFLDGADFTKGVPSMVTTLDDLMDEFGEPDKAAAEVKIEAFTEIGGGQSAGALAVALQDADASLRVEAIEALADIGGETAMRLLSQALEDQDNAVRKAANEALTELLSHDL